MAEPQSSAQVHYMPDMNDDVPPPGDDEVSSYLGSKDAEPVAAPGGGGKRARRKPQANAGNLQRLFNDFAYQYGTEIAWDIDNRIPMKISHMRHTFGHDAVKLWMGSEKRRMVLAEEVVFDPSGSCDKQCVNLFAGWPLKPEFGDTGPFHRVLEHLCGGDEAAKDYILNWYAYPLQNPGAKMPTALVFHGAEGTGKNLVNECVAKIHGTHAKVVGQRELESPWNDWIASRTFVIGDEVVSRQELRHHKGVLKALITSTEINIAARFMNLRSERNCMNMVFLSNELEPLKLDPTDRRYLVIWTQRRGDPKLYSEFVAWERDGGPARLYEELLKRDLTGWEWYSPPPMTQAKEALIGLGRMSAERFWLEWRGREMGLPFWTCSADQAYRAYTRWCRMEGERYPLTKPVFARSVAREADENLRIKTVALKGVGTTRMWIISTPPPEADMGSWSGECVDAFEAALQRWSGAEVQGG